MQQIFRLLILLFLISHINNAAFAGPWFTGPILAPSGHTIPRGHTNFEVYGLDVFSYGSYNQSGQFVKSPYYKSFVINPILTHGFTDWMDVQLIVPYVFNNSLGQNSNRLADVSTAIGLQLIEQKGSPWKPDVRFVIQEVFPTGSYERLNPFALGTDSTGIGSYQTKLSLNFQYLKQLFETHYLRTRLILSRRHAAPVNVHGLNSYGGTPNTNGTISAGTVNSADLAFEYTLTQNWVAVMEGYATRGEATRFDGDVDVGNLGSPIANIGRGRFSEDGLAPAIEYNFNSNIGLIGGVWFPVRGTNTSSFITYTLALNAYW